MEAVTDKTISVIGFSLGARLALELSVAKPELIHKVVAFYGNSGLDYSPAKAAYLGHFAETDPYVSASGVKKLEKSLRATMLTTPPSAQLAWESRLLNF